MCNVKKWVVESIMNEKSKNRKINCLNILRQINGWNVEEIYNKDDPFDLDINLSLKSYLIDDGKKDNK